MVVLSLFDGISAGRVALERIGIKVDKYYASEIDKYAIQITMKNHPDTIQLGDITKWQEWDIEQPDLIIGGSPCQGFSFAGKQLNFDDPRSALFFEFAKVVKHYKPKYFLLENVKMKKEYQDVITEFMGVEPVLINSALVSAQNRQRLYWTNIPGLKQPEDKGILLKDIIDGVDVLKEKSQTIPATIYKENAKSMIKRNKKELLVVDRDKSYCLDANYYKGGNPEQYFEKKRRQLVFKIDEIK
jgi:DNA-cytosine methyltransferase